MSCSAKETTLVSLIVVLIGTTIKLLSLVIVVLKRFFLICDKLTIASYIITTSMTNIISTNVTVWGF